LARAAIVGDPHHCPQLPPQFGQDLADNFALAFDTGAEQFVRDILVDCSSGHEARQPLGSGELVKEGVGCWAKIAAAAAIPPSVAPPPAKACMVAYGKDKAPADDPSIVFFDVDIVVGVDGKAETKSLGPAGCARACDITIRR